MTIIKDKSDKKNYSQPIVFITALWAIKIDLGCIYILAVFLILSYFIFSEINPIRLKIKEIFCTYYINKQSALFRLCQGRILSNILSLAAAAIISSALIIFVYLLEIKDFILIYFDIFIFYSFYFGVKNAIENHLKEDVAEIFLSLIMISINSFILGILFFISSYFTDVSFTILDPSLPEKVISDIKHSCQIFQDITRTSNYIDLNILTFKSIPGVGHYIFSFVYVISISIIPFIGISLIILRSINAKTKKYLSKITS